MRFAASSPFRVPPFVAGVPSVTRLVHGDTLRVPAVRRSTTLLIVLLVVAERGRTSGFGRINRLAV